MRIMFLLTEPAYPDVIGGGVLSIHEFASHLHQAGHRTSVAAALVSSNQNSLRQRSIRKINRTLGDTQLFRGMQRVYSNRRGVRSSWVREDNDPGYPIYKMPMPMVMELLPRLLELEKPDVTLAQGRGREQLALVSLSLGIPSIIRPVCASCVDSIQDMARLVPELAQSISAGKILIVSNSKFIASRVLDKLHVESPVVYPPVSFAQSVSTKRRPEFVTFMNPTAVKGVDLALEIAALLPHRKFAFVESWSLNTKARRALKRQTDDIPNIYLRPVTLDVRTVYESTALLLAPSQWEEAFGRVVLEACANGIPVVASAIGGIPEAMGGGGVLLAAEDPGDRWAEAIESVLSNPELYKRLSEAGIAHARQKQFDVEAISVGFGQLAERFAALRS